MDDSEKGAVHMPTAFQKNWASFREMLIPKRQSRGQLLRDAGITFCILAIAAAVIYQVIGGKFGATQRVCYDQWVVLLLIGGGMVSGALVGLKKYGVASAIAAFAPFAAICFFAHKCYWYVTDVFVAIDEKGFDPNFLWFAGLALGAFIIGEIAVYTRKEKAV